MSVARPLPCHLRPRREKLFGAGRTIPLDRNAKVRVMTLARALSRRTEKGKHYGAVTAKALAVLELLLWGFHNAVDGRCFPSLQTIADKAGCARSTVAEAIKALEAAELLTWCNRIKRVREWVPGLFGTAGASRWRVIRTSNGYRFRDPAPGLQRDSSKSDLPAGTGIKDSSPSIPAHDPALSAALDRLEGAFSAARKRDGAPTAHLGAKG